MSISVPVGQNWVTKVESNASDSFFFLCWSTSGPGSSPFIFTAKKRHDGILNWKGTLVAAPCFLALFLTSKANSDVIIWRKREQICPPDSLKVSPTLCFVAVTQWNRLLPLPLTDWNQTGKERCPNLSSSNFATLTRDQEEQLVDIEYLKLCL